jgi:Uma2 family endonuclease
MLTKILPLENGDRLNRYEFEKRSQTISKSQKAELIDGVVYIDRAVKYQGHGVPHGYMIGWLASYVANTPGVELADNATVRLDLENAPQPDILLRIKTELGGQSRISEDDYVEGAPELIIEIAGSSASYDLYDKLKVYHRHGVKEYIVWQVYEQKMDWFCLQEGEYIKLEADSSGLIESKNFPGLVLSIKEMLELNLAKVLAILNENINTEKHRDFIKKLNKVN